MGGRPMCGAVPQGESSCHRQGGRDEYPSDEPEPRPGRRDGLPPRAAAGRGRRRATGPRRTRTPRPADRPPDRPAPRARPPGRGGPHRPRPARGVTATQLVSGPAPASGGAGPDTIGDVTRAGAETPFVGRADDVRRPLVDAVRTLLATAGERAGALVVVLEDLHWADRSSRDLLHFLLARLRSEHVVLVASYRTDDLHRRHPLRQVLADLVRLPRVDRVELAPFDARELTEYLTALSGGPVDEPTVSDVLARSEGNAYFAEELMAWRDRAPGGIPAGLADVLLARVERLGPAAQHLARVASVAGRRVTDTVLVEVGGLPAAEVDSALREAVAHLVLVPDAAPDGTAGYAFRHALLREAVYEDLLPGERARLHAAYATLLSSSRSADGRGVAAAVAYHAMAAHDLPLALGASIRAAKEAQASRAPAEALVHLTQALGLWDAVDDAEATTGLCRVTLGLETAAAASA